MFKKLNEVKDGLKMLKNLQNGLTNMDMTSPDSMKESMKMLGLDMEEIEKNFHQQYDQKLAVRYVLDSENVVPEYHYATDSGFDIRSNEDVVLDSLDRVLISTGLYVDIPERCELQIRTKSGLAINRGLMVLNSPATIDRGYTGEIKIILINLGREPQTIKKGDKIAQAVICSVISGGEVELIRVNKINEKDRNNNGFGSTGN